MDTLKLIKDITRPARLGFYERKKWNDFSIQIKKQRKNNSQNNLNIKYINKPGIAFSFDDSFRVDGWNAVIKDLFGYYDVRATFNVNAFHHFEGKREHTQREIDMLLELQANGHEIAHHTFKHYNSVEYVKKYGIEQWINYEIKPLFEWLEKQQHSKTKDRFKRPVSFAFPYFVSNEKTVEALANYFKVVRGGPKEGLLTSFNQNGFIQSIDIDRNLLSDPHNIKKVLKNIKLTGKNLIFTCHSVLDDHIDWSDFGFGKESEDAGRYRISPATLEYIIKEAKKQDLVFYTTAEMAGVATFLDQNFEEYIRQLLSIPKNQWIKISDLVSIKEIDLSYKNIKNLDGIQYFLNLEKLDISYNNILDLRLLEKLPKLKCLLQDDQLRKIKEV